MPNVVLKSAALILLSAFLTFPPVRTSANAQVPRQRIKPSSEQESRMLGMVLAATQDHHGGFLQEARSRYEQIIREIEKYDYSQNLRWLAYDGYGKNLLATGDKKKGFKTLARALEEARLLSSREIVKTLSGIGSAHAEDNNFPEAISQYTAALAIAPHDSDLLLDLGSVYRRAKMYPEARATYEKIMAAEPQNAKAYGNLGNLYLDQGELEKAVAEYENFARYSYDKEVAARNFLVAGFRYYEKRNFSAALTWYNRALSVTPDNPLAYADIGWVKLEMGQVPDAIAAFEKSLTLNPSKSEKEYARKGLKEARARK